MLYSKEATRIESAWRVYKILTHEGRCAVCGDTFKSRSPMTRFCSQRCKNDAAIRARRELVAAKRAAHCVCEVCAQPIPQTGGKVRRFCCAACKQSAYRKRHEST